jgi:hypothetical protein
MPPRRRSPSPSIARSAQCSDIRSAITRAGWPPSPRAPGGVLAAGACRLSGCVSSKTSKRRA